MESINRLHNAAPQGSPRMAIYVGIVLIICILLYLIRRAYLDNSILSTPENVNVKKEEQLYEYESIFNDSLFKDRKSIYDSFKGDDAIKENEDCLINFQPLTVIQPGYIGPEKNGVFSVKEGVANAIKLGARSLILPIDYYSSTVSESLNKPNIPCFLYRDEGENMRSINSGSIKEAVDTIASLAWSNLSFQKNDPMIVVLYFVRTPEKDSKEYVQFLSKVAQDLNPLSPYFLTQTPSGNYFRQGKQNDLLFEPVRSFEKKCLIFSNIDTTIFRNKEKLKNLKLSDFSPKEDLDYIVNLQLFKQNKDTPLGPTELEKQTVQARGLVENVSYYTTLPSDNSSKDRVLYASQQKWNIALSPAGTCPTVDTTKKMLNLGIQSIPIPLFGKKEDVYAHLDLWKSAWLKKPLNIRYIKPDTIHPDQQSPLANSNGGSLNV